MKFVFDEEKFTREFNFFWQNNFHCFAEKNLACLNQYSPISLSSFVQENLAKLSLTYAVKVLNTNQYLNLTAIHEAADFIDLHFFDTLCLLEAMYKFFYEQSKQFNILETAKIIDLGTGLGVPGFYLHLIHNFKNLHLLDALNKRLQFIDKTMLDISDIFNFEFNKLFFHHERIEDFAHNKEERASYDIVMARAVASMSTLIEYAAPLLKKNSYFFAMKASKQELIEAETAMKILKVNKVGEYKFNLVNGALRYIFVLEKFDDSPKKYPRKPPQPSKKPLK